MNVNGTEYITLVDHERELNRLRAENAEMLSMIDECKGIIEVYPFGTMQHYAREVWRPEWMRKANELIARNSKR